MPALKATFIEPMLLLRTEQLPEGAGWDVRVETRWLPGSVHERPAAKWLRSRKQNKDFNTLYPAVAKALAALPDESVRTHGLVT